MKVYLYAGNRKMIEKSGVGRAYYHQKRALENSDITLVPNYKDSDIVHINTVFLKSLWLSKKAKKDGKKVIYHAHSTMEDFRNSFPCSNALAPLFKKWIMKCYESADAIITPTSYSKMLLKNYGIRKPIKNISNGIDLEFYQRQADDRLHFREKYGFKETDKVIISAGLYIDRKGIREFVKLAKRLPQYKFVWFGYLSPLLTTNKVKQSLNTKLPNLFFPGYISKEEMREAYGGADLFLFLSKEETEGLVVLEAFSMKTPTLLRDIGVFEPWIKKGTHAYKECNFMQFEKRIISMLEGNSPSLVDSAYEIAIS